MLNPEKHLQVIQIQKMNFSNDSKLDEPSMSANTVYQQIQFEHTHFQRGSGGCRFSDASDRKKG